MKQRIPPDGRMIGRVLRSDKLYLAAVEGPAFGAGVGLAAAKRFLLTGDEIDQAAALEQGLADYAASEGRALDIAQTLAKRLAYGPPLAQATVKQFFTQDFKGMNAVLDWERRTAINNFLTRDFTEGASAFLEKRVPSFQGR